jgi:hypothetical protein
MTWTKLASIGAVRSGCGNCPPRPATLPLDADIHPGFGIVRLTRDGETVEEDLWGGILVEHYENRADATTRADQDPDWRLEVHGPMGGVVYQRHAPGEWVAVKRLEGFA